MHHLKNENDCGVLLRSNDHHVAIGNSAHTDQEVRQGHSELEPANGTLAVIVTIEKDRILCVTLWKQK